MKSIILLLSICVTHLCFTQTENLLENGSFESLKGKLKGMGGIETANTWFSPTPSKADLYVKESKIPGVLTSENQYGKEDPKNGDNFIGIVTFSYNDKVPRSYVSTELKAPMIKGMKYCVTMYASLAEGSKYASNQLAFNFSTKSLEQKEKTSIITASHILHPQKKIINATYGWEKICGTYIAEGGEKFITIGNFTNNEGTKNEKTPKNAKFKGTQAIAAYYFIDDLHITAIDPKNNCNCYEGDNNKNDAFYHKVIMLEDHLTPSQRIEAHTTFFPFGQSALQEANKATLRVIVDLMKTNPEFKLELFGHIDSLEQVYAQKRPAFADLSNKRIKSVIEYFIENEIDINRLIATPKDEVEPNEEITLEDDDALKMAKNRRVMFKVITK